MQKILADNYFYALAETLNSNKTLKTKIDHLKLLHVVKVS